MKATFTILFAASLAVVGCKKKEDAAPAAGSAAKPAAEGTAPGTAAPAVATKSCADLGGTPDSSRPDTCMLKATTPAPFEATFTGKYDTTSTRPEPGALFKVTNKFGSPVRISNASLYAYDKTGKQVEITGAGGKSKYAQDSKMSLIELNAGETKDFVHSVRKEMLPPDVDALQLEFTAWETQDGKAKFVRNLETGQDEVRPKDGWK
jgi:hypothetical protein